VANDTFTAFTDGYVQIFDVTNAAAAGNTPVASLTPKVELRFKERTVGVQRFYAALQENVTVSRLLRCPAIMSVSTQDVAQVDGDEFYKIRQVQYPENVTPRVMDLSLERTVQKFEVSDV
jgi:hypothetical protein